MSLPKNTATTAGICGQLVLTADSGLSSVMTVPGQRSRTDRATADHQKMMHAKTARDDQRLELEVRGSYVSHRMFCSEMFTHKTLEAIQAEKQEAR